MSQERESRVALAAVSAVGVRGLFEGSSGGPRREVGRLKRLARARMEPVASVGPVPHPGRSVAPVLWVFGRAKLPSRFGDFEIVAFSGRNGPIEHVAILRGDVAGAEGLPVRIHSECVTGDALGSLKCDCRDQVELALRGFAGRSSGVFVYMRQEGRGIGLAHKVRAYALQDAGLDTVEANEHLGFEDDLREYSEAAAILRCLGVRSVVLLTNNPRKIDGLLRNGIPVVQRESLVARPNVHNALYLHTKRRKLGHLP